MMRFRLIDELDLKPGEVDLRLLTRWHFKPHFETCRPGRSQFAHAIAYDAVAASEAAFLELTPQPHGGEGGIGSQSFAQIGFEVIDDARPWCPLFVNRRLQPDLGPDCLSIDTKLPGESADRPWRCKSRIMTSSSSSITAPSLPPAGGASAIRCAGRPSRACP